MVARGGCTPFHSVISARFARSNSEPSSRVQIHPRYLPQQKSPTLSSEAFCYGSEGGIRTLDTWIMIPPL